MLVKRYYIVGLFALLTLAVLLVTSVAGVAISAFASMGKMEKDVQPAPIPQLSADLRDQLNSALAPEFPFNFDAVGNPFLDKSGVSLSIGNQSSPAAINNSTGLNNTLSNPTNVPLQIPKPGITPVQSFPNGQIPQPMVVKPVIEQKVNTKDLLDDRQRQIKLGNKNVPSIASLYSIDELRPYGVVGSGDRNRVKLFAPGTNNRFSVGKGTRLRDGTIEAIDNEGATFRRDDGQKVFLRWMKSARKNSNQNGDSPLMRVKPQYPQTADKQP